MKITTMSGKPAVRLGLVAGAAAALFVATASTASAASLTFTRNLDGCVGQLQVQHNYNGTGHDYVRGVFDGSAADAQGYNCKFQLVSMDSSDFVYARSGIHDGVNGDTTTYWNSDAGVKSWVYIELDDVYGGYITSADTASY